jgi:hypothetical protein
MFTVYQIDESIAMTPNDGAVMTHPKGGYKLLQSAK